MNDYPFIKCLHPQLVYNKYIGESVQVPCGKCSACQLATASRWSILNDIQCMDYKYCMFVTLTYNNDSIPSLQPIVVDFGTDKQKVVFRVNQPDRFNLSDNIYLSSDGYLLSDDGLDYFHLKSFDTDLNYFAQFVDKCNMSGDIPVLCQNDIQKFFKRFRYYLKKYEISEKITYFVVGEYGPIHFRSHAHALIFFNTDVLFQRFKEILYKSWQFGHLDFSLSRGGCASYVASYLNSVVGIPELFKAKAIKPFRLHSSHFATSFYEAKREEIYKSDLRGFISQIRRIGNKDQFISIWRNLAFSLFPKCRDFVRSDYYTLYRLYTAYGFGSQYFKEYRISALIPLILNSGLDYFKPIIYDSLTNCIRNYDQIYYDLYVSKHFFEKVCGALWENTCSRIRLIQDFYSKLELSRLRDFYISQEKHTSDIDYRYFYDYFNLSYDVLPVYKEFKSAVSARKFKQVKHKKLNDLNKMFVSYE